MAAAGFDGVPDHHGPGGAGLATKPRQMAWPIRPAIRDSALARPLASPKCYTITSRQSAEHTDDHHHHHHHPPGHAHPPAAIAPSILRLSVLERLAVAAVLIALIWAGGDLGDALMTLHVPTPQLQFRDLTLGYDRHPAVHHLDGAVDAGRADGGGRAERRRQVDPVQGHRRRDQAARRPHRSRRPVARATSPICRRRPRSTARFPINVYDMVAMGLWRTHRRLFGGIAQGRSHENSRRRSPRSASPASSAAPSARCRADRCSACCSRGCCCRTRG